MDIQNSLKKANDELLKEYYQSPYGGSIHNPYGSYNSYQQPTQQSQPKQSTSSNSSSSKKNDKDDKDGNGFLKTVLAAGAAIGGGYAYHKYRQSQKPSHRIGKALSKQVAKHGPNAINAASSFVTHHLGSTIPDKVSK